MQNNSWVHTLKTVQSDAEKGYYIIGAYHRLLCIGLVYWGALLLLLSVTTVITSILTLPVLVYWVLRYIVFCQWWRKMHFSKLYLIGMPIVSAVLAVVLRWLLEIGL